ncbi:hypothetical protein XELAEV_18042147mg [Xenopus laevis]|uniref:Uncharacterized protein n=1 Tax=Xenopus laevis TaxID=8355 RepID=A0A974H5U0_XENLA|nr:hypothetical protein XELAEV_18042147mg [Xenopus laevis]
MDRSTNGSMQKDNIHNDTEQWRNYSPAGPGTGWAPETPLSGPPPYESQSAAGVSYTTTVSLLKERFYWRVSLQCFSMFTHIFSMLMHFCQVTKEVPVTVLLHTEEEGGGSHMGGPENAMYFALFNCGAPGNAIYWETKGSRMCSTMLHTGEVGLDCTWVSLYTP